MNFNRLRFFMRAIGGVSTLSLLTIGCTNVVPPVDGSTDAAIVGPELPDSGNSAAPATGSNPTASANNSNQPAASDPNSSTNGGNPTPPSVIVTGTVNNPPPGTDLNNDGVLNQTDINILLSLMGPDKAGSLTGDFNKDGVVDLKDLGYMISLFPQ